MTVATAVVWSSGREEIKKMKMTNTMNKEYTKDMKAINKRKVWIVISAVLFVMMVVVNSIGSAGIINGMSQQAISDKYYTLITPAGYAFSIWGVIYIAIIVFWIWSMVKSTEGSTKLFRFFSYSCILNAGWIVCFSYEWLWASVVLIALLLYTLIRCLMCLKEDGISRTKSPGGVAFGIYAGWVMAATVLNVALAIKYTTGGQVFGLSGANQAIIMILIALVIFMLLGMWLKNPLFFLAGAWAYLGILVERLNDVGSSDVLNGVLIGGVVVLAGACVSIYWRSRKNRGR